jgi:hypothetical protein
MPPHIPLKLELPKTGVVFLRRAVVTAGVKTSTEVSTVHPRHLQPALISLLLFSNNPTVEWSECAGAYIHGTAANAAGEGSVVCRVEWGAL